MKKSSAQEADRAADLDSRQSGLEEEDDDFPTGEDVSDLTQ